MSAPTVTALPTSPARLSRPNNFLTESAVFLEALPAFRTQVNQLSSYINSQTTNKWNLGSITGVRSFPTLFQTLLVNEEYINDSISFTGNLDAIYAILKEYSTNLTSVGVWLDNVINDVGIAPYDLDKPMISGVTSPMTRLQDREPFNTTATLFTETAIDNINSLYQGVWYTHNINCGNDTNGVITDTNIFRIIDCGSITDTVIEY